MAARELLISQIDYESLFQNFDASLVHVRFKEMPYDIVNEFVVNQIPFKIMRYQVK